MCAVDGVYTKGDFYIFQRNQEGEKEKRRRRKQEAEERERKRARAETQGQSARVVDRKASAVQSRCNDFMG